MTDNYSDTHPSISHNNGYFCSVQSQNKYMKYKLLLFITLPVLLIFSSCETDFDVTADYKEIAIVYGLLSQNDTVHYLRINKAFLGDGSAIQYADIQDSSSFGDDINVVLTETNINGITKDIQFDTASIHNKEDGIFYSPDQLMYRANYVLDPKSTYQLKVSHKKTSYEVSSITNLVQDFSITRPTAAANVIPKLDFKRDTVSVQKIEWNTAVNGRLYQPTLRFYFKETSFSSDTINRYIDWVFPSLKASDLLGGKKLSVDFKSEAFYLLCEDKIPYADPSQEEAVNTRLADHFDILFTVVGDEFSTYLDVNGPTTGLLLEKPSYSNINNGLGLFSSIYHKTLYTRVGDKIKADLQVKTNLHFFAN